MRPVVHMSIQVMFLTLFFAIYQLASAAGYVDFVDALFVVMTLAMLYGIYRGWKLLK